MGLLLFVRGWLTLRLAHVEEVNDIKSKEVKIEGKKLTHDKEREMQLQTGSGSAKETENICPIENTDR